MCGDVFGPDCSKLTTMSVIDYRKLPRSVDGKILRLPYGAHSYYGGDIEVVSEEKYIKGDEVWVKITFLAQHNIDKMIVGFYADLKSERGVNTSLTFYVREKLNNRLIPVQTVQNRRNTLIKHCLLVRSSSIRKDAQLNRWFPSVFSLSERCWRDYTNYLLRKTVE